ncbi:AraC family transcriptional regulator [Variovorax paradoxus]|nr:AraC family transcriptional regulator [Variovorax paradoxus]
MRTLAPNPSASSPSDADGSANLSVALAELARLIAKHAPTDGVHETGIKSVSAIRLSQPNEPIGAIQDPAICVIAQGSKRAMLGDEVYVYDESCYLVAAVGLPVTAHVTTASPEAPYLCFRLALDPGEIAALLLKAGSPPAPRRASSRGMFLSRVTPSMLDAVLRLMRLLDSPDDLEALAPLAIHEILYRVLRSEEGPRLAQIATADSHAHRIARAVAWLKAHFAEPLRIEDMARQVHMSTSSLHQHFRAVTSMSPLQYQKQIRLQEARKLMLSELVDAATAGHRVGYESPSQFSREYSRFFGAPPARDLQRLRQVY